MIKRLIASLLLVLLATTSLAQKLPHSIVPDRYNPHTCEADSKAGLLGRLPTPCQQLAVAYAWEPTAKGVLDSTNALPYIGSDFKNPVTVKKATDALDSLAMLAQRVSNDYVKPDSERAVMAHCGGNCDLVGNFMTASRLAFSERDWELPNTPKDVFQYLSDRVKKEADPLQQQAILIVATQRGNDLFALARDATRVMVSAANPSFLTTEQKDALAAEQEAKLKENQGYFAGVKRRAGEYPGILPHIFNSLLLAGLGLFLGRRLIPPGRSKLAVFLGGAAAYFVASSLVGVFQVLTGVPIWVSLILILILFGVIYVAARDKLQSVFGGRSSIATHGSAAWASLADAVGAGRLFERGMVSADSYGFAMGRFANSPANLDPRLRYMGHVLTCAPTGSGKGIGAVVPTLLEYPGSIFCLDIKGENYAITARARRTMGHTVCLVDPFGVTGAHASAFNPLDVLDLANPDVVGQAAALVDTLVVAGASQDDSSAHFNDSAKDLIKGLIVYAKSLPDPARRTLGEVRRLLTLPLSAPPDSGRETLASHLADMSGDDGVAFGIPARAANAFTSKESKEASGVLSTAQRHTSFLDDPRIVEALSRSDFNLADLKRTPMTVYVVMPPDRLAAQARFMRALVGAALSAITATSDKPKFNTLFLLDEFAQLGRMPAIEDAISLVRGYGARFWLFVQDLSQLKGVYPKWQTFLANSAKQFYGTSDFETAKYVSDMLGQTTIEFRTVGDSSTSALQGGGSSGTSSSQQLTGRSLLTPDEVMRHGPTHPIVLIQGEPPYSLDRLNYLVDPEYSGLADANPFHQ